MRQVLIGLVMVVTAAGAWAQKPLAVSQVELDQHVVKRAAVEYMAAAEAGHVSGTVMLMVNVSATGHVTGVKALSGPAVLEAAAVKSVKQWVYRPFEKDGTAMAATGMVRVVFDMNGSWTPAEKFMAKVHAKYASEPELARVGFHCRVWPAWREFPQLKNVAEGSALLQRLKRTRVTLMVLAGGTPIVAAKKANNPALNVDDLARADELLGMTRRMVNGLVMTWIPFGIAGPDAPPDATMKTADGETVITFRRGGVTDWMSFDADLRMHHFTELMPNGEAVEETPQFEASPEGMLYTGTDFAMHRGKTTTHGAYRVTYRQVDGYRLPKRVEVRVEKSLDVHFRFTGCKIGN